MSTLAAAECDCPFEGCERPTLHYEKSTDGTIVTWKPSSSEAKVVILRNWVRNNFMEAVRQQKRFSANGWGDDIKECVCKACFRPMNKLSIVVDHMKYEEKRLISLLRLILDARTRDQGKTKHPGLGLADRK